MYSTEWSEDVKADEEPRHTRLAERIAAIKTIQDARHNERGRAVHRRCHAGARGVLSVPHELALPAPLQVGPFRPGAAWAAWIRFSSGSFAKQKDNKPDVRGVAVKLLGVPGRKVISGLDTPLTQDFLLNQTSGTSARSPEEFVALVDAFSKGELGGPFRLASELGVGRAFTLMSGQLKSMSTSFPSFANSSFWSMVPFRLGPTAARFSLAPVGNVASTGAGLDADLNAHLRSGFEWDVRAQLYQDPKRTPIEDPSVDWEAPWIVIGRLTIPPADEATLAEHAAYVDRLSFDPWHCVEELRPLGAMNRARKLAYYLGSAKNRDTVPEEDVE